MIDIFKYSKGPTPSIMNEILMLGNTLYTISYLKGLHSQLLKTVYCGIVSLVYKGPELDQQIPEKTKK